MSASTSILTRLLVATALASGSMPAWAQQPPIVVEVTGEQSQIVVTATRERRAAVEGVDPERSIDEDSVASYGVGTVGDVLEAIADELGEGGEEPVLYVNGVPIADPGDIVDYPSEAIERIDVLPRGTGARLGGSSDRRAYNIVLRRSFGSTTGTISERFATAGGFSALTGEVFVTRIAGPRRFNLSARFVDESLLRESERGLIQPDLAFPYDIVGNLLPGPGMTEIDPAFSALVGTRVTVAALDADAIPSLASLAANAGITNLTDLGDFRSLRPATRRYALGFTGNMPLTGKLGAALTARWERDEFESLQGLRAGLFLLPATSVHSPFGQDVIIARYSGNSPLSQHTRLDRASLDLTLNAQLGEWLLSARGGHRQFAISTNSERQDRSPTQPLVLDPQVNPFVADVSPLLPVFLDRSRSKTNTTTAELLASGPIIRLPAGDARASFTTGWTRIDQEGQTRSRFFDADRNVQRTEWLGSVSLELPLVAPDMDGLGAIGTVSTTLDYAVTHVPGLGEIERGGVGLRWLPVQSINVWTSLTTERRLPDPSQLGDPRSVTQNVRYFDPVRLETVDVTQTGGGNPELLNERYRTMRVSVTYDALRAIDLRLIGEFVRTQLQNPITYLPPSSADLIVAFPERFVRDATGSLASVDIRPVNLVERNSQQLRWGATFLVPLSANLRPGPDGTMPPVVAGQSRWRLQGAANYIYELSDEVILRENLPSLNLLGGGALGFSGATPRRRADASLSLSDREVGLRLTANWRGDALLNAGSPASPSQLRFDKFATFDLRAFADLQQLFSDVTYLEKTKLTIGVANIFNARQRVLDEFGETPLRYQQGYRDPLGRTIELELRKQF